MLTAFPRHGFRLLSFLVMTLIVGLVLDRALIGLLSFAIMRDADAALAAVFLVYLGFFACAQLLLLGWLLPVAVVFFVVLYGMIGGTTRFNAVERAAF